MRKWSEPTSWEFAAAAPSSPEQFGSPPTAILVELNATKHKLQESDGRPLVTTEVRTRRFCPASAPATLCLTGEFRVTEAASLFSL